MGEEALYYRILLGGFTLLQAVLAAWSWLKNRSWSLAAATMFLPFTVPALWPMLALKSRPIYVVAPMLIFSLIPIPLNLWLLRPALKDNQVGGVVTYLGVIAGIVYFLWMFPPDEVPWMVIFTMEFFSGLALLNIVDLAVIMRYRSG
jgi:hypothetical protein